MTSTMITERASAKGISLAVVLRFEKDGPEVTREPVLESDLSDVHSEAWLAGCLRKGFPDVGVDNLSYDLIPLFKENSAPRCAGFVLESTNPDGEKARTEFSISSLDQVASRAGQRLVANNLMKAGDDYYFEAVVDRRRHAPPVAAASEPPLAPPFRRGDTGGFKVTVKNPPLTYLTMPLPPLLERAEVVGSVDERTYPVLYTAAALAKAMKFSRKGAGQDPPVETGAVLIGPLCSCPQTGEFYTVVCDVLEVLDAEESQFSLTYSSKSWSRIQAVMKAKQAQAATRAHRILGQCHGHNFKPLNGAAPCDMCFKLKVCSRTSVFVSTDDRKWMQATFARQPWQLSHIFGLNARGEEVHSLFGLRDGRLLERGFHVIPDSPHEA